MNQINNTKKNEYDLLNDEIQKSGGIITSEIISKSINTYLKYNKPIDITEQIFNLQLKLVNVFDNFKASPTTTSIGGNTPDTNLNEGYQKILRDNYNKPNPDIFVNNLVNNLVNAYVIETYGAKSKNPTDIFKTISGKCYTINNAAKLETITINSKNTNFNKIFKKDNLIDSVFCPQTSIIDAMSNCSFSSKERNKLFGDMKFSIVNAKNAASRYGGKVNYKEKDKVCVIDLNLVISGKSSVDIKQNVALGEPEAPLTAHIVYYKVCKVLQDKFNKLNPKPNNIQDLWQSVNYNYYGDVSDNPMKNTQNWNEICGAILVKSCGDFLQEINGVTKYGSYTDKEPIVVESTNRKILQYDTDGNAFRLSLQNDRPSAFRSIFLLQQGLEGINELAIAGFFSGNASFLAWRRGLIHLPNPKSGQTGKKGGKLTKKQFKRYRQRQTNKQKMRNKNKKNVTKRQFKTRHFKKRTFKK